MAKEKNLTNVTTVAAADFIRLVTSAGASVKGTLENFAKSLLTTSFSGLSLGGSQQSVKDALDSLNSKTTGSVSKASGISGGTLDSNTLIKVGNTVYGSARLYGISQTANGVFFTIPSGFRPSQTIRVMGSIEISGVGVEATLASIGTDGNVTIAYSNSKTATLVSFAGSWTVA